MTVIGAIPADEDFATGNAVWEAGMVLPYTGSTGAIPAGWLLCDGSSKAVATYPALHTALGGTGSNYGSDGTNFFLPDKRGRYVPGNRTAAGSNPEREGSLVGSREAIHYHATNGNHTHPYSGSTFGASAVLSGVLEGAALGMSRSDHVHSYSGTSSSSGAGGFGITLGTEMPHIVIGGFIIKT